MPIRLAFAAFVMVCSFAWAQIDTKEQVLELTSGDKVVVRADGSMAHYDARGNAIAMPEGVVMTVKDGTRVVMKDRALWREILDVAGNAYGRANAEPFPAKTEDRRIPLQDGGWLAMDAGGGMVHYDRAGRVVAMKDGEVMTAKDGSRILMVNGAAWRETARVEAGKRKQ